jgi:hypothetical protein
LKNRRTAENSVFIKPNGAKTGGLRKKSPGPKVGPWKKRRFSSYTCSPPSRESRRPIPQPGPKRARPGIPIMGLSFEQNLSGSPEDAPSLARPLRGPKLLSRLDPENYYFLQWREGSYETIEDGMEDFLRQLWWEGKTCKGPSSSGC